MVVIKAVTLVAAVLLSILALRQMAAAIEASRARVKAQRPQPPRQARKLRQDPRTGIYYPEA